jgi:hypothetical protein
MSLGARKSMRSSAGEFRDKMYIFAISMRFEEENPLSHGNFGFLRIFVGVSVSVILIAVLAIL